MRKFHTSYIIIRKNYNEIYSHNAKMTINIINQYIIYENKST